MNKKKRLEKEYVHLDKFFIYQKMIKENINFQMDLKDLIIQ